MRSLQEALDHQMERIRRMADHALTPLADLFDTDQFIPTPEEIHTMAQVARRYPVQETAQSLEEAAAELHACHAALTHLGETLFADELNIEGDSEPARGEPEAMLPYLDERSRGVLCQATALRKRLGALAARFNLQDGEVGQPIPVDREGFIQEEDLGRGDVPAGGLRRRR